MNSVENYTDHESIMNIQTIKYQLKTTKTSVAQINIIQHYH